MNADPFDEIRYITESLRPVAFFARIELWRKGGVTGVNYESHVSGTRAPKLPAFDVTDQKLNEADMLYRLYLEGASVAKRCGDEREQLRSLRKAQDLEALWLKPIVTPDKEMAKELGRLADDAQSCNECGDTKRAWVQRMKKLGHKTPLWRLRTGMCSACYQDKRKAKLAESEAVAS